ncbi:hypothetical protein AMST5_03596 [freshwater sediment metagenome]|uniref:VRR-NUC domain-containing protein n=1 Tax=freshwater sediment metagenome TaxID=556182 RepID=A0AA48M5J5_9ZZZZ
MTIPPLLLLAEGRRPRARKVTWARPKEIHLHMDVARLLRTHCRSDWQWTHIGHGEARDKRTAAKLKHMGLRAGWPDFVLVPPTGQFHALELKRPGEILSPAQDAFKLCAVRHGVPYVVAYQVSDVLTAFSAWRCLNDNAASLLGGGHG